nr:T9SS type A sorting domain-containing protein [Chitinophagaceae bacterium]
NKYGFVHTNGLLIRSHAYTFNTGTNLWEPTQGVSVINYYYNYLPNATSNISAKSNDFFLYPNPCETYLHIQGDLVGEKFVIYSVDGKFIQSGIVGTNRQIFVQTLPEGNYFFRSEKDGKRIQEIFLKQ